MSRDTDDLLEFKFHWLNEQGHQTTTFKKKGSFDGETLTLEETEIPVAAIVQTIVQDNVMVLAVITGDENDPVATILIRPATKKATDDLKEEMDVARSGVWAKHHREELEKKGLGHTYRDEICPCCDATLILTDMPETPQLYCHFCDSLSTLDADAATAKTETQLRICEECGMYSKPQKFTIFYFYFLIVFYGYWSKATWRCPNCMRGDAWKMFFGNLPFVLGVPVAVTQLFRSYGGSSAGGNYKGLDAGNIRATKGDLPRALKSYQDILERIPNSAGVKYNLGMALLMQGDRERAAETFELALEDCANYAPAYQQLVQLYPMIGEHEKLKELERIWSSGEEEEEEQKKRAGQTLEEFEMDLD